MILLHLFTLYDASPKLVKVFVLFVTLLCHTRVSYSRPEHWWESRSTNVTLSTPEECDRPCVNNEPPKNCYYKFHIELYTTVGPACNVKAQLSQCIIADGFEKTLMPINRQLPGPSINVCLNDRIIVDVENAVPGMEATIHWHGVVQKGYQYYDGVPYVTQCPIASASTFRYDFMAQNAGTHFYHSHISTHMMDGEYGPLIIRNPPSKEPHLKLYDADEHVIFLSDWIHELSLDRFPGWFRQNVGQAAQNLLVNGMGNWTDPRTKNTTNASLAVFKVTKGKRYRMRMINSFSTVCLAEFRILNHDCFIIAQDGENVKPKRVDKIITSSGERVDFILKANKNVDSYWIQIRGLGECKDNKVQQLAILQYEGGPSVPSAPRPTYDNVLPGVEYNGLNGTKCNTNDTQEVVCVNQLESLEEDGDLLKVEPDERHVLGFWFFNYTLLGNKPLFEANSYPPYLAAADYSQLLSVFNNYAYESGASPLISQKSSYQTVCKPNQLDTCTEPCTCSQVIHSKLNNVVELVIYDEYQQDDLDHPFHLHGYAFKVFSIGQYTDGRNITEADMDEAIAQHTQRLQRGEYRNLPGKDTVKIPQGGYAIIRFKATNPGWWLLHCHFTWHHITGMELVIRVGEKRDLPPVPPGFPKCDNWKPAIQTLNDFYGFKPKKQWRNFNHLSTFTE